MKKTKHAPKKKEIIKKNKKSRILKEQQKSRQNEITTNYPLIQRSTETVNLLRKGRNVADALWSVHVLYETPIC